MIRSMYSGISGLKNFQSKLDVIGNNIANVNTFGFKKGRIVFKDLYSQTVAGAAAPTADRGGVNSKQLGLGSSMAAIDTIHSVGSIQTTGNTLDLAIEGDGFFVVGEDGDLTTASFTRAGNFYLDEVGDIVDGDGRYLLTDAGAKISVPIEATSLAIGQNGEVNAVVGGIVENLGSVALAKFSNPGGLTKKGGNLYEASSNSGVASIGPALADGRGAIKSGTLEMSNVDLSEEFTEMIVAQRAFQANTRVITTSDEILQELVNLKR